MHVTNLSYLEYAFTKRMSLREYYILRTSALFWSGQQLEVLVEK